MPAHPKRRRDPILANALMNFELDDYSVVVKNRAPRAAKPWCWEIYRAGRDKPVERSPVYFETMTMAQRAGREAFKGFKARFNT
jgi:hypothetical protein